MPVCSYTKLSRALDTMSDAKPIYHFQGLLQVLPEITSLNGLIPEHLAIWAQMEHIPSVAVTADHQVPVSRA